MPRLVDRFPNVEPGRLISELVPPPRFAAESFDTYVPDPAQPTQSAAVAGLHAFATQMNAPAVTQRFRFRRAAPPELREGIYLDGGFGVGQDAPARRAVARRPGPQGLRDVRRVHTPRGGPRLRERPSSALSGHRLVCIDEFELDDPGDTVLMSTLLNRLVDAGVRLAATSNTLPDRLGEGRFAADDFLREIQGLAAHFDVYRIDGEDYRHRGLPEAPDPLSESEVVAAAGEGWLDDFPALMAHLTRVHPSRYGALLDGVDRVHLLGVRPLSDQADALRLVVLADRLYDRDIPVVAAGVPLDTVFGADMLKGRLPQEVLPGDLPAGRPGP